MAHKLKKFDVELHWRMATSGAYGLRVLAPAATSAVGEFICEIYASTAATVTATAVTGDNLAALAVPAGTSIQGVFSSVTATTGTLLCKLCSANE